MASVTSLLSFSHAAHAYNSQPPSSNPVISPTLIDTDIPYANETTLDDLIEAEISTEAAELLAFDLFGLIKLPIFQGSNAFDGIFRGAIAHFFVRSIGNSIRAELPIVVDASFIYPTVDLLPDLELSPTEGSVRFTDTVEANQWYAASYGRDTADEDRTDTLEAQVARMATSQELSVALSPGDYVIPIDLYCVPVKVDYQPEQKKYNRHLLSPLRGQRAASAMAFNASTINFERALSIRINQQVEAELDAAQNEINAAPSNIDVELSEAAQAEITRTIRNRIISANDISSEDIRALSYALLTGFSYEELDPTAQTVADLLLSEYSDQISGGFLVRARRDYESFTDSHPDVTFPSFDDVLDNLGPLGPVVQNYRQLHSEIQVNEENYQAVVTGLTELEDSNNLSTVITGEGPWSVLSERVYARLVTPEPCADLLEINESSTGALQIRVLPARSIDRLKPADVPIMGIFGDPRDDTLAPVIGIPRLPQDSVSDDSQNDIE
ncbi:MAG: hypothetical protein AAFY17_08180 [Cyanobacteria bacterium J06642_11]